MPAPFASRPSPKIVFGPGTLGELPALVREAGATSVFLVTDSGLIRAGHAARATALLEAAGIPVTLYDHAHENPSESDAAACRDAARAAKFDCFVALGGGSSMDTAKATNFLLTNGGAMRDYHGYGKATKPLLPLIAVPTTAGTGSECQSYALVSRDDTHEKMACGDPKALARAAILDPELTATQPRAVAILTGLDALAHALESAVTSKRNPISAAYSEASFRQLSAAIARVIVGEATAEDRGRMLLGAALAGLAIENSMLGAAHATANPLTARHGVTHGHAVALMLPQVMRFNAADAAVAAIYAHFAGLLPVGPELAQAGLTQVRPYETTAGAAPLIAWVADLVSASLLPAFDARAVDVAALADDATRQWTGKFNPRPLQAADFAALYRHALGMEK
ncbi:MAG: iron-containing alcohol dehydrogenase [Opitutaceae bacterium]|nr:iron-containing alcohol dehydrogenase [Opitutaceae bacterium]